jgi:hypothetical protein
MVRFVSSSNASQFPKKNFFGAKLARKTRKRGDRSDALAARQQKKNETG